MVYLMHYLIYTICSFYLKNENQLRRKNLHSYILKLSYMVFM